MNRSRYDAYRETGIDWLGRVPAHWTVAAIKRLSPVQRGASPRPIDDPKYFDDDGDYAWVRIADVTASDGLLRETTQRLSDLGSSLSVKLEPGSLFVSIAGTVGKPCIAGIRACIHDGFVYFPRLQVDSRWLYRVFEAGICYGGLGKLGTQLNLNTDTIGSIKIALPPAGEMEGILGFLDLEIAKLDSLMSEQTRLVDLLTEKRRAMISRAVTRGLNPLAAMQHTGIEWLGTVPSHWRLKPLKYLASFKSGGTPDKGKAAYWDGDIPWASAKDMKVERLEDTEDHITQVAIDEGVASLVARGSILVVVRGMILARNFPVVRANVELAINQDLKALLPREELDADYLSWLLRGFESAILGSFLDEAAHGTKALRMDRWELMALPVPPRDEQIEIVEYLVGATASLTDMIEETEGILTLLQERRTTLISAAVTGKIDVRGVVAAEPGREAAA